jgi:anthranilate synthase/phosphoribosyltransferase
VGRTTPLHGKSSLVRHDASDIFQGVTNPFRAGRYHSLVVEPDELPHPLIVSARTDEGIIMALRHREHPTFGVQFHPNPSSRRTGVSSSGTSFGSRKRCRRDRLGAFRLADALPRLAARQSLSRKEAQGAMSTLLAGEATPAQAGAFLLGLRSKGETEEEIAGLVEGMREAGVKIRPRREPLLDLCGTGGDGSGTFNISTGASLVAAGAGAAVAKHGNRSASSRCGSADVLEALGVPIDLPPERAERAVDEVGFAFLFAPLYHPAMKHVAAIRKELKIRTVFNLLGPLSSPATVPYQLVGVYEGAVRGTVARVLSLLGSRRAWVVHGAGGLDELSLAGPADVTASGTETGGSTRSEFRVGPEDCGLPSCPVESILGGRRGAERSDPRAGARGRRGSASRRHRAQRGCRSGRGRHCARASGGRRASARCDRLRRCTARPQRASEIPVSANATILDRILATKRAEVAARARTMPLEKLSEAVRRPRRAAASWPRFRGETGRARP